MLRKIQGRVIETQMQEPFYDGDNSGARVGFTLYGGCPVTDLQMSCADAELLRKDLADAIKETRAFNRTKKKGKGK